MSGLCVTPNKSELLRRYHGKDVKSLDTPAAIIDIAKARENCRGMLDTAAALGVAFRAHTKTHKTVELADMQVRTSDSGRDIRHVVSTVAEMEHMLDSLVTAREREGAVIDIIYGLPISSSNIPRIMRLLPLLQDSEAPQQAISFLVDHPDQIPLLMKHRNEWPVSTPIQVWVKIDTGYHRSGVQPGSQSFDKVFAAIAEHSRGGGLELRGLYSHLGHSYAGNSPQEAIRGLLHEVRSLKEVWTQVSSNYTLKTTSQVVLTVGATPTATSAAQLLATPGDAACVELQQYLDGFKKSGSNVELELHAGVYPVLDMQQAATHARTPRGDMSAKYPGLSMDNIALTILVEVVSLYDDREKPEVLVSAGSLAMGREPCKSYPGWGVVTPWSEEGQQVTHQVYNPDDAEPTGWIIGRISQEHGILSWEGPREKMRPLTIGQRLQVYPNHACVAGVGFGWYNVVDSSSEDPDKIKDVWVRCRGW